MKVPTTFSDDDDTAPAPGIRPSPMHMLMAQAMVSDPERFKLAMDTSQFPRSTNIEDRRPNREAITPILQQQQQDRIQAAKERIRGRGKK